ncbi:MAG: hypothetical protein IT572_04580 [Deltaproteobacteria bacterium]|nr:hypothetical protein [Deltaproteobacteria bacterium]
MNHDGILEDCSGCTCPIGCAADGVTACGSSAPISQLKKICVSIWLDDARFYAGAFDRVPTFDNPESGEIRMLLTKTMDLSGSTVRILYNHHDPFNLITDSLIFLKDIEETGPSLNQYFGRYRSLIDQRGEPEKALLDVKFSSEIFEREIDGHTVPGGLLEFQSKSFRHLDFINLELLAKGIFGNGDYFGYVDITPPTCALISSGDPIDPVNCSDLGLDLFAGDFVPLIPVENTLLPPLSQFPETPPSPPFTP